MERHSNRRHVNLEVLTLQFDRRRYDGGSEIELIAFIERQQAQAGRLMGEPMASLTRPTPQPRQSAEAERSQTVCKSPAHSRRTVVRLTEALIAGPVAVVVGLVGILTSILAIGIFANGGNAALAAQSRDVLRECALTLAKGVGDTFLAPVRAVGVLLKRA
ncbi:MAG: hypothetical protein IPK79_03045 [Vampirovibrionales bacterium]|nr:hypothetical protein [Vampirovibrionales bacterium]